jgi:hypothetical protein
MYKKTGLRPILISPLSIPTNTLDPDLPSVLVPSALPLMYIPFASLLGLQAALEPLAVKQPAPETASLDGINFVDPRPGGGSLLDHDSGGLGEPLNVSTYFSTLPEEQKAENQNQNQKL